MAAQYEITIKGLVQGVGFRPFIYVLAHELNLRGTVENNTSGVFIQLQSTEAQKDLFLQRIVNEKPSVSHIADIEICETEAKFEFHQFSIVASNHSCGDITRISPDIAICDKCLADYHQQSHRIHYPFVNCTHCGPRFSIVESIPYDRPFTTMKEFEMCSICNDEYKNPLDRRFHAQPVACNHCGPVYTACIGETVINDYQTIVDKIAVTLLKGGIVALKGVGGFNWLADATNDEAVKKLRELKRRYIKPFAVMCNSEKWVTENMIVSEKEWEQLLSWRRPIVLLNEKRKLSSQINDHLHTIGVMFPYMAIHYEIFKKSGLEAIVFTSANKSGEPMLRDNTDARAYLLNSSDLYVEHNRAIYNRVDDSVIRVIDDKPQVMRRARGYAPEPIMNIDDVDGGLAFGAEMTAVFALGVGHQILMSQYIGDLSDYEVYEAYKDTLNRLSTLFHFTPQYLVCDSHPQYLSSKLAEQIAKEKKLPLYYIQHHHAHAVSVMVEYDLTEECLALSMDGIGYGDDGESWGCEVMKCDRIQYERLTHLPYVSLPGGDKAAKECWRMAVSYLYAIYGSLDMLPPTLINQVGEDKIHQLSRLLISPLNNQLTSSAGRLFDAVAALLGVCYVNTYQAEAAMRLEQLATTALFDTKIYSSHALGDWDMSSIFQGMLADIKDNVETAIVAMRFHRSLVAQLVAIMQRYANETNLNKVLLAGGVFQNRLLSELLIKELEDKGLDVYYPTIIPCNDGGVAVGQLAIAAARLNKKNDYA